MALGGRKYIARDFVVFDWNLLWGAHTDIAGHCGRAVPSIFTRDEPGDEHRGNNVNVLFCMDRLVLHRGPIECITVFWWEYVFKSPLSIG